MRDAAHEQALPGVRASETDPPHAAWDRSRADVAGAHLALTHAARQVTKSPRRLCAMNGSRRMPTPHLIAWPDVACTSVAYDGLSYAIDDERGLAVTNGAGERIEVGSYAKRQGDAVAIKLTPGCETYYEARAYHGDPFDDSDLVAAAIVAAVAGHPDAGKGRSGTELSAVWSHHLAIVGREDPRQIARTYAPTETKTISGQIQHMATLGIEVLRAHGATRARPRHR
jgi:hypothetical protein